MKNYQIIYCKNCGQGTTWANQKTQFKRLKKLGLEKNNIDAILPLCHKCLTNRIKNHSTVATVATFPF